MPKIGVAVPCYKPHLQKLLRLLASIEAQIVLPDIVIVSCSSTTLADLPVFPTYRFNVQIVTHCGRLNAAENRNCAAGLMPPEIDIISFIDGDDIMHPQRIAAIAAAAGDAELIMHNYYDIQDLGRQWDMYDTIPIEYQCIRRSPSWCAIHMHDSSARLHHSMVSVSRRVFNAVKFRTEAEYERREDAVFCGDALTIGIPTAYICVPLAKYDYAGVWLSGSALGP